MISQRDFPLIDMLMARLRLPVHDLGRVALVCHQHLLPSTGVLFSKLIETGLSSANIFVLGKPYSAVSQTLDEIRRLGVVVQPITYNFSPGCYDAAVTTDCHKLWDAVRERHAHDAFSRIVVLDDGGHLRSNLPQSLLGRLPIVAVEQTASGVRRNPESPVPTIVVAHSAAKRHFESPFIANALLRKLKTLPCWDESHHVGMLGLGFLGRYVAELLKSECLSVAGYDPHPTHDKANIPVTSHNSVAQVVQNSDLLLGCSGTDVMSLDTDLVRCHGTKTLISCSSGDVEFNKLLRELNDRPGSDLRNPFADLHGTLNGGNLEVEIINGGFPINFDRNTEWEATHEIQLTRALLYAGIAQALALGNHPRPPSRTIMLDPHIQKDIVKTWLDLPANRDDVTRYISHNPHIDWWIKESGGDYLDLGLGREPRLMQCKSS